MAKKKKISLVSLILLAVAAVGLILAIVGICIDYFAIAVGDKSTLYKLFVDENVFTLGIAKADMSIAVPQAFAILSVIAAAACTAITVLNALGIVKLKFFVKLIVCAVAVVFAVLALSLGFAYIGQYAGEFAGHKLNTCALAAGGWLLPIGTIVSAVPALLVK